MLFNTHNESNAQWTRQIRPPRAKNTCLKKSSTTRKRVPNYEQCLGILFKNLLFYFIYSGMFLEMFDGN